MKYKVTFGLMAGMALAGCATKGIEQPAMNSTAIAEQRHKIDRLLVQAQNNRETLENLLNTIGKISGQPDLKDRMIKGCEPATDFQDDSIHTGSWAGWNNPDVLKYKELRELNRENRCLSKGVQTAIDQLMLGLIDMGGKMSIPTFVLPEALKSNP